MRTRARTQQAKSLRREKILGAAARVWSRSTFDEFTMADVARKARLAKGTLYLYFSTKEQLLLELLASGLERWLVEFESRLEATGAPRDPDELARLVASTLLAHEDLVRLLMILGAILEHNVPEQQIREFKIWLHARLARTGAALERCLPFLEGWGGVRLLLHLQALVCGIGQLARPAPAVARVLATPELEPFRVDFEAELRLALAALMRGASASRSTSRRSRDEIGGGHDD